jgi:ribosome-associated toxin RatA of RatAB toxin-antitoxin module
VARSVEVEVAPPTIYPDRSEMEISWRAAGMPSLFPELRGRFELAAVDAGRSRLSFEASYEPPGRLAGQLVDRAMLHRVAEASVREFVLRTAQALGRRANAFKQD